MRRRPLYGVALSTKPLPRGGEPFARAGIWRATRLPCPSGEDPAVPLSSLTRQGNHAIGAYSGGLTR
jgi:hypothetical protein